LKKIFTFFMMFLIVFSLSTVGLANEVALPDEVIDTEQVESVQQTNSSTISSGFNKEKFDEKAKEAGETAKEVGDKAAGFGQKVLEQVVKWCAPFCALGVIWGAVQYFVLGIRNLYKKRQGLLTMWGCLTFYVVALFINLILTFMSGT